MWSAAVSLQFVPYNFLQRPKELCASMCLMHDCKQFEMQVNFSQNARHVQESLPKLHAAGLAVECLAGCAAGQAAGCSKACSNPNGMV